MVIINCIYEVLWDDFKSVKNCRFFNCDKTRSLIAKLIFSKNKLLSWITFDLLSAHVHVVEKHNLEKIIFTLHWLHFILFCSVSTDLQFVSYTNVDLTGAMPGPPPSFFSFLFNLLSNQLWQQQLLLCSALHLTSSGLTI